VLPHAMLIVLYILQETRKLEAWKQNNIGEPMTFRPYTGKVRLGDTEVFLDIADLPDGYVLSREGTQIIATLIGQDKLNLAEPSKSGDAATKGYVDSEINLEESARIVGGAAETSARAAAISAEASTRAAADAALDVRIDNILSNTTADSLDSLTEIVSAFQDADGYLQDLLSNLTTGSGSALAAETSARIAADAILQGNIGTEASIRAAADSSLASSLGSETSSRIAGDGYLHGLIIDEVERATGAEEALQGNIDAEASTRAAAVLSLQGEVDSEESARAAQDTILQGNITAEASARAAADLALSGDLGLEESARIAGDADLQSQINSILSNTTADSLDSLTEIVSAFQSADGYLISVLESLSTGSSSALGLETSARVAADGVLQGNIDAEASVRSYFDGVLSNSIETEKSDRVSAGLGLSARISAEESARAAQDAVLQSNIDTEASARIAADATKLSLSGGTMTGIIAMGSNKITGLADGTDAADAVTVSQLQSAITAIDPAGSTGQIQFNADGYDFGASANLTWNNAQNSLFVGGAAKVSGVVSLGEVAEVPTSESGFGKLFAKNDDGLYFVDSKGVNHYILLDGYVQLSGTSVALDASPALPVYRSLTMTGATTFTTSNLGIGRSVSVRLVAGAAERTVTFPAGWTWLGGATPTSVPADKVAMLSFVAYGTADTDVVAAWSFNDSASISGGGATGQVAFYDGTRSVAGDANLTWDSENDRLVVGTVASPAASLHVGGTAQVDGAATLNGAVTLGDGYADAITVNGTTTFNQPVSMGSNKITNLATPSGDNDAVNVAFLESRRRLAIQSIAGTGTVGADIDVVFVTGSGGGVVRLPLAAEGNAGKVVVIKKRNSGPEDNVGTASGSGQSIDGVVASSSTGLQELMLENESLTFLSDGSNWFII
jgi:hypothetical protein